jgi:hypothetical protein
MRLSNFYRNKIQDILNLSQVQLVWRELLFPFWNMQLKITSQLQITFFSLISFNEGKVIEYLYNCLFTIYAISGVLKI